MRACRGMTHLFDRVVGMLPLGNPVPDCEGPGITQSVSSKHVGVRLDTYDEEGFYLMRGLIPKEKLEVPILNRFVAPRPRTPAADGLGQNMPKPSVEED